MTRVGFYVVRAGRGPGCLEVAVRLAEKAFQQGHDIFINAADEAQARDLDELLWTHRPTGFLPHGLHGDPLGSAIAIGWGQEPEGHDDLLINLRSGVPSFFSRFRRVAEIVGQDAASLEAQRRSYLFYKQRGYQLETHRV